ncbi:prolactin-2A1-like [Cricetulus griseus]|uniref:Prolactin-2A1-like n=1 Tax=Cricetulus griseus TaxID=10029 RepID=A0A9J7JKR5_CRIGR|nr:prolactin-2A1-like [Cricetulus griseus]XP_027265364.1 prolactin-2A1-like [Cricetulus griseus]
MQLSLMYPGLWTLLLLLMSNLLLWKDVSSLPNCAIRNGRCFASLEEMLNLAVSMSQDISEQAFKMFTEFDNQYAQSHQLINRSLKKCHTSSLNLPKPRSKALQTHPIVLLKLVKSLLAAWKVPMYHLVKEMPSLKDVPDTMLSKARDIEQKSTGLLEGIKSILSQIQSKDDGDEKYPVWSGQASLKSDTEDARQFAFYNLIRCAGKNAQKVESALMIVRCQILKKNNC